MARKKPKRRGRSWTTERASVRSGRSRQPRSNKYRPKADVSKTPRSGSRTRYWRGGYLRRDGTYVRGHYVKNPHYRQRR